jgi:hypothetical protein
VLTVGRGQRRRLRVAAVAAVVAAGAAQVDPARERHVPARVGHVAQHHELLVVGARPAHPLVQQDLTARRVHLVTELPVLVSAVGQLVGVRAPHQPLHHHAAARGVAEQPAHGGAFGTEQFVGVAAPVGEEEVVAGPQLPHLRSQAGEVAAAVHVGPDVVALAPVRLPVGRVAALGSREEPLRSPHPCLPSAPHAPSPD